jgi:hypothetical protein
MFSGCQFISRASCHGNAKKGPPMIECWNICCCMMMHFFSVSFLQWKLGLGPDERDNVELDNFRQWRIVKNRKKENIISGTIISSN